MYDSMNETFGISVMSVYTHTYISIFIFTSLQTSIQPLGIECGVLTRKCAFVWICE